MRVVTNKVFKRATAFAFAFMLAVTAVTGSMQVLFSESANAYVAPSTTYTVDKNNMEAWFFYNDETDTIDNTLGSFVNGPDTAPLGDGSVQISVSGTQRRNIATYQFYSIALEDIDALSYETYNASAGNGGSSNRAGYMQFNVSFDGADTWQKRLTFVPSNNGTVLQNTWQTWDAINSGNANWTYSGATWPSSAIAGTTPRTWDDILTSYPNITTRTTDSFFGIRVGEPYTNGYTENIDNFVINVNGIENIYDFEPVAVPACSGDETTFDTGFTDGSVNGQNGWESTGPFDQAVVANDFGVSSFGCKSLRISNAVTSGSFGDQTFTYSTANEAGEVDSTNGGKSGGTRQNRFEAQFDIASTLADYQPGMSVSVSPDRGDGSRMSYLRFEDQADERIHVFFDDYQGTDFVETEVGVITHDAHTIKFAIDYKDGASNDIVKIYIDGVLVHTGTSWEDYYRFDPEAVAEQTPRTTDSLIFRVAGTAVPANAGKGFLFDNFGITTSTVVPVVPVDPTPPTTPASGGTTPPPASPVVSLFTPAITSPADVLGAETDNNDGTTDVEGATDVAAIDTDASDGAIFGVMWYWWIIILAGLTGLTWGVIGGIRRRNGNDQ